MSYADRAQNTVFGWPSRAECECHRESGSHESCCGHEDGRNPDCPIHGDGTTGRSTGMRL